MVPRRFTARLAMGALATMIAAAGLTVAGAPPVTATAAYTTQALHFAVRVGPSGQQACDIVGDLYTPSGASASRRVPAILTTNGFGGSAADQTPFAERYAALGYAVLSYSGLGFGGSGCKITLDDPDYDGQAASQLISFLGGAPGIAFADAAHSVPAAAVTYVVHDARDHHGVARTYDPRVGMWGGSYGGQIQFATAAVDARVDMLNPQITWNDLSYSLGPNNAGQSTGVSSPTPGVTKSTWAAAFSAIGMFDGVQYAAGDPQRLVGCPNFADFVCPALAFGATAGYLQPAAVSSLRHASVASYLSRVTIPVLLDQGEVDTLFNLNESVATYRALRAQGTPTALMWRYNGHSGGTPSMTGAAYEANRIQAWFDHYLKSATEPAGAGPGPAFAYYRDWDGQVGTASSYPIGTAQSYYLSGSSLVSDASGIRSGVQSFVTPAAGAPTGLGGLDVVGSQVTVPLDQPDVNVAGTFASWTGKPLTGPLTVVGSPTLDVSLSAPSAQTTQSAGPAGQLVVIAKLYDVGPDGSPHLINGLVAPVRVLDVSRPVHIILPAFAHRFATGHSLAVYLSGGDTNYRTGTTPTAVTITTGSALQRLTLPVLP